MPGRFYINFEEDFQKGSCKSLNAQDFIDKNSGGFNANKFAEVIANFIGISRNTSQEMSYAILHDLSFGCEFEKPTFAIRLTNALALHAVDENFYKETLLIISRLIMEAELAGIDYLVIWDDFG